VAAEDEQTCRIYANVHFKITYAEMGFSENLQKYIVKIEKTSNEQLWKFNRKLPTQKQSFSAFVSFQFIKMEQSDLDNDHIVTQESWWSLNEDLFYAFASKSAATSLPAIATSLAASVLLINFAL